MARKRLLVLVVPLLGFCACGYSDAGSGTETLLVRGSTLFAVKDNRTLLRVDVSKRGSSVDNANVLIRAEGGDEWVLALEDDNGERGRYERRVEGYHRRLELEVFRGADELEARLEGPGAHIITDPANGASTRTGRDLQVRWRTEDGIAASRVVLELDDSDYDTTKDEDTGELTIAAGHLNAGDETVKVTRWTDLDLAGGVGGSTLSSGYEVENDFLLTP